MTECLRSSASVLHKRWAELEDEHDELAIAIDVARAMRADLAPMRQRQARLLLDINSLVAEIRDARRRRWKTSARCSTSRSSTKSTLHPTSLSTGRRIFL